MDPKELFLKTVTRFCKLLRPKTFVLDLETLTLLQESLILTCFQNLFSNDSYTLWLNIWAPPNKCVSKIVTRFCQSLCPKTFGLDSETLVLIQGASLIWICFQSLVFWWLLHVLVEYLGHRRIVFESQLHAFANYCVQNFRFRFSNIGFITRVIGLNILPKPCFLIAVSRFC